MIGFRHHETCLCPCIFAVGLDGDVIEESADLDVAVVRFMVPNAAGGPPRPNDVAYSLAALR